MKNQNEITADLKGLINVLNDGKEGYKEAIQNVKSEELKSIFMDLSNERAAYAEELKAHILQHGNYADNEDGSVLGTLHRAWLDVKEVFSSNEESAILNAIETGEKVAIEKYDAVLKDHADHFDHYSLLNKQRNGIQKALDKIKTLGLQYQD
jgi:uncharacterized protein (TIGR02284 family)